jgi:hypothetical protein
MSHYQLDLPKRKSDTIVSDVDQDQKDRKTKVDSSQSCVLANAEGGSGVLSWNKNVATGPCKI